MSIERWPNEDDMIDELYGGVWADSERWAQRCDPEGCVICTAGRPHGIVGKLAHTWVATDPEVAVYGYVCVISTSHVVEPFDLPSPDQATFWHEAMAVARAISARLRPIKMNYEIHGNTLPHLHMHLLPRQPDDPFVGRPIDLKEFHHRYTESDLEMLKAVVRSAALDKA